MKRRKVNKNLLDDLLNIKLDYLKFNILVDDGSCIKDKGN